MPLQVLAAFLLYELSKGAKSFWYPYLREPSYFLHLPVLLLSRGS